MHADEIDIDDAVVQRLLERQRPDLAGLHLVRLDTWGTDHVIYRLGDALSVRLPKIGWAAAQSHKEARFLPAIGQQVSVAVPTPLFVGEPDEGYPYAWCISRWLPGEPPSDGADVELAREVATFVRALEQVDTAGAPVAIGSQRGGPLARADESTRAAGAALRDAIDVDAALAVWEAGVRARPWSGPDVWVHGDLTEGNLLVVGGRLSGVVDWGGLKAGDPAVELMIAWTFFDEAARAAYLDALGFVDDDMWLRGRSWAVSAALHALPYYRDTNPVICGRSWRALRAAVADL